MKAITSFDELRRQAQAAGPRHLAVVAAEDEEVLAAAASALSLQIVTATLIGNSRAIRECVTRLGLTQLKREALIIHAAEPRQAAKIGVSLCRHGEADLLLKGKIRTDELLHAVLDKTTGIRSERLLSDVLLYEDATSGARRLIGITDGGINVLPAIAGKQEIIRNAVAVMHALGRERPRLALMSATEVVTDAIPSTVEARALTELGERGELGACDVFGPLALDNALFESAARAKGIVSPVAGHADVLVVPNIEAGNLLGKAVKYFYGSACAHVVIGAKVPVLIPSRVESADDKLYSIALGVLVRADIR